MGEDNIVKIVVALITLFGTSLGIIVGYVGRTKKQSIIDAKREQQQADHFDKLFAEMSDIKKRLDEHNKYAEKFGDIEKSIIAIKKDIQYIIKNKED